MAENELPLVRQFQWPIICYQRTKIGEAIEVWPSPKVGVSGQSIVIIAKTELFEIVFIYFLRPLWSFCTDFFFLRSLVSSLPTGKKLLSSGAFSFLRTWIPQLGKGPFLICTNPLFCTLCWQFNLTFWSKKDNRVPSVSRNIISMTLSTFRSNLGGSLASPISNTTLNRGLIPMRQYP